jgi:hypothetical protein
MAKPRNYITQGPNSYAAFASRRSSSVAAAAQHGTKDLAGRNYSSPEDLARWEGEGGAAKQRSEASKALRKPLAMKCAISGRASHDSPHRSYVETMMTVPMASVTASAFHVEPRAGR